MYNSSTNADVYCKRGGGGTRPQENGRSFGKNILQCAQIATALEDYGQVANPLPLPLPQVYVNEYELWNKYKSVSSMTCT